MAFLQLGIAETHFALLVIYFVEIKKKKNLDGRQKSVLIRKSLSVAPGGKLSLDRQKGVRNVMLRQEAEANLVY